MSLGNNIKRIREIKNISIDEMVKKLSTFKQTYINIEKGLLKPKKDILIKLSNIFDMNENDIINFREEILINNIRQLDIKNLKDIVSTVEVKVKPKEPQTILTPITKTPISVVLEDLSVKDIVYKKPILLTSSELFQIGNKIKTVEVKETLPNETFIDRFGELDPNLIVSKDRSFSSRLLNWIEPYVINGVEKTLFYTEINTGLKVGDKVFIVNGNYDSNKFIQDNKYKRGVDGYEVLFIDNCKVVLNIDYENKKSLFIDDEIDNFINIYYIEEKGEFLQSNRQITSRGGNFNYKFGKNQNNIAFFNTNFESISNDWGTSSGIPQRGFYVKDNDNWIDISDDITSGSFSYALSEYYTNNGKIKIHNGSFTFSVGSEIVSFIDGLVYDWVSFSALDGIPGKTFSWVVDSRYNIPFITKSNFRLGDFNGIFNSGIYGTLDRRIEWDKERFEKATWNSGLLLNTNWISGDMNSINSLPESYVSEFDEVGKPYQRLSATNNNGWGYNYIERSEFHKIDIENGVFSDSKIGNSLTYSITEEYIIGSTNSNIYDFTINKALLSRCSVIGGLVKNSDILNSKILNTKLENIKSINSNYQLSVIKDSIYISDNIIKIIDYDEFNIIPKDLEDSEKRHKVYKFYIDEDDYKSIKIRDRFYIKGLSIRDRSKYPLNLFDRNFKISSWTEYFDSYKNDQFIKRGVEVGAFLSTPADNDWKLNYVLSPSKETVITEENENRKYSIDIIISVLDKNNDEFTNDGFTNELPINGLGINKPIVDSSGLGENDKSFIVDGGFTGMVNIVKVDSLGRVLVGGNFTSYRGVNCNRIIRLNSDGTRDTSFNIGNGFNDEVFEIEIDSSNRLLIGGRFTGYDNRSSRGMIRLNQDGSIDKTFNFVSSFGSNLTKVKTIKVQEDGKILVGGFFNRYNGETLSPRGNIIRINSDGIRDASFDAWFDVNGPESINVIKIQSDGKILVGGYFPSYKDVDNTSLFVRLNQSGDLDGSFNNGLTFSSSNFVNDIEIQKNTGEILIAGRLFSSYDGKNLYKLEVNGNLSNTFSSPNFNNEINSIIISDNKLYVAGSFNIVVNGFNRNSFEILDLDSGSVDNTFITNRFDANSVVNSLEVDQFGRVYAVGQFTFYNNQPYRGIVRINTLNSEPPSLGDNIDISNAYIINSNFESGIIENTDWVSGNNINYNNDVNIVDNNFGTYSIMALTASSELIVKTGHDSKYSESNDYFLEEGNIVFLGNIEYQSPNGEVIKLGDTYKITEGFNSGNQLRLKEVGTNIITSITQSGGTFSTKGAQNRYNYINLSKITKSKISSGIFRRSYLTECFIESNKIDLSDKDFNNIINLKELIISDSIFKSGNNILSKALYMNSSFVGESDKFENGIVYNSIWNGSTFKRGVFKESRWVDGEFNSGLFYNNRSFDGVTSSISPMYNDERVKSYYKDGITTSTQSNNRYTWQSGEFNGGDFLESDWENGEFNSGKFYYSKFYNGNINGGVIGDRTIPLTNTVVYNGTINFTTVENATLISKDNSSGITSSIIWKDGFFNGGEFGSNDNHIAIWENGEFNSGNFENMAIWKNGRFNGGRFLSTYGWTMSDSINQLDYTWQNGEFNGGEFGSANGASNSTWFTGEFNGGKFVGRVWNNGIFTNGEFIGSATYSPIGDVTATSSNAILFTDSFSSSFYGVWRDGIFGNKKDDFIKDREILKPTVRSKSRLSNVEASIINSLWLNGTFSHSSGSMQNSVWLNGIFERGIFFNSSFNPYVKRDGSLKFELSDSCRWINGSLINSDFYISKWEKGIFDTGNAYGMIWRNGVCNYMNAFNIFWEGGTWRNGNWYGSYIDYNGTIEDDFYKQILLRGVSWSGTQSMHLWNIFDDSSPSTEVISASATDISQI